MRVVGCIAAFPFLLLAWSWWGDHREEARLAPIASAVAGRQLAVDCQGFLAALVDTQWREGEVRFNADGVPEAKVFLTRRECGRLRRFASGVRHPELVCLATLDWRSAQPLTLGSPCYERASPTIYAILVLAHEAYHTAGIADEATANCYAIQAMAWTAARLGADAAEADLTARAMAALEPLQDGPYATTDCSEGRSLDLHPETPDFPTEHPLAPPLGRGGAKGLASGA